MTPITTITLTRLADKCKCAANLVELNRERARQIDLTWWERVPPGSRESQGDGHWNWCDNLDKVRGEVVDQWVRPLALLTTDGRIQGAIIYHVNTMSHFEPGRKAFYGEFLATAPWNREELGAAEFRGVGTGLLLAAVAESHEDGLGGRLGIAALPRPDLLEWYERFGFRRTGRTCRTMIHMELTTQAAADRLRESGLI